MRDLVRDGFKAKVRYWDATREMGKLDSDLATIQAALPASKETASALAEAADARAWAAGAPRMPRASICFYF
jgi:hypothetical protein